MDQPGPSVLNIGIRVGRNPELTRKGLLGKTVCQSGTFDTFSDLVAVHKTNIIQQVVF
ncbi:hypothetical protein SDC9_88804 [bioreactor metagenome]|uniref:Uncharacterized protein n=1 Tax=bioreactor metagenome TaxID=1076179 RepID=A0A644ZMT6_9ZZZZ